MADNGTLPAYHVVVSPPRPQTVCTMLQQHEKLLKDLRKALDQQSAAIAELQKIQGAQAPTEHRVREIVLAQERINARLAEQGGRITTQTGIIDRHTSAIEALRHDMDVVATSAFAGILIALGFAMISTLFGRRRARPDRTATPTSDEIVAALHRSILRRP